MAESPEPPLVCSYGRPWLDHFKPPIGTGRGCLYCVTATASGCLAFDRAVAEGVYDAEGYTPKERRLQQRKCNRLQS